ncbi:NTP transferase domain-containing protein [Candidatus Roizmanbacteria bacterium]|nr:NTP transferase domain-containing protein [Candidatus Roizmanbacteria bacterium]
MNALILAGGFGTRLGVSGKTTPKGLLTHGKTALLEYILEELKRTNSIRKIALVTNARFYSVYKKWLQLFYPSLDVNVVNDGVSQPDKRKGALGDFVFSTTRLRWQGSDLLVTPSDTYFQFSFQKLIFFYEKRKAFTTVVRRFNDVSEIENRLGCAVVKHDNIVEFIEKPKKAISHYAAIPFYIYPTNFVNRVKEYQKTGGNMDTPGSVIPWLLQKNIQVFAFQTTSTTLDVGTETDIRKLQQL